MREPNRGQSERERVASQSLSIVENGGTGLGWQVFHRHGARHAALGSPQNQRKNLCASAAWPEDLPPSVLKAEQAIKLIKHALPKIALGGVGLDLAWTGVRETLLPLATIAADSHSQPYPTAEEAASSMLKA